jgi:hypothetical protein
MMHEDEKLNQRKIIKKGLFTHLENHLHAKNLIKGWKRSVNDVATIIIIKRVRNSFNSALE